MSKRFLLNIYRRLGARLPARVPASRRIFRRAFQGAALGGLALLAGCASSAGSRARKTEFQVVWVTDRRIKTLSLEQLEAVVANVESTFRRVRGYKVKFKLKAKWSIGRFMAQYEKKLKGPKYAQLRSLMTPDLEDPKQKTLLQDLVTRQVAKAGPETLRDHYPEAPKDLKGPQAWSRYVFDDFRKKYKALRQRRGAAPPLIDPEHPEFSSPWTWRAIALESKNDLIITNALIAGPQSDLPIFRLARGGMISGLLEKEGDGWTEDGTVVISTQPALCRSPFDLGIPGDSAGRFVGYYAAHHFRNNLIPLKDHSDPLGVAAEVLRKSPP